jgi:hypothetical protein
MHSPVDDSEHTTHQTNPLGKYASELSAAAAPLWVDAILQVKDAQQYLRNWQSTVSSVQDHCSRQQQLATLPTTLPYPLGPPLAAPQSTITPSHCHAPGIENRFHAAPAMPLYHVDQTPQAHMPASGTLPRTVVYSTTVNVPQTPALGCSDSHLQPSTTADAMTSGQCTHGAHATHIVPPECHQGVLPGGPGHQLPCTPYHPVGVSTSLPRNMPGHLSWSCGNVNCTERSRMPFSDASNLASGAVRQAVVPNICGIHSGESQPRAVHAFDGVHAHPYSLGNQETYSSSTWNNTGNSLGHESEESGDRYKSSALLRMQRMQVCL